MDKRTLILEAALGLFVDNGFHGTSTSKIAKQADVANGTLFHYFKTKDELIISLYSDIKNQMADYILANTVTDATTKEALKSQFLSSLFWALDNTMKFRYIQQIHSSPYLSMIPTDELSRQMQPHLMLIKKGIEEKLLKPLPVDFLYFLISSHTFGLYQFLTTKPFSKARQYEMIKLSFDLLWDMLT